MSKRTVKVGIRDLHKVVSALENYINDYKKLEKELPKLIAEEGKKILDNEYDTLYQDDNLTDINTKIEKSENGYKLVAYGSDVIYAEFGTGDIGQNNPHPRKNDYNLNDYNSGPYIRNVSDVDEWSGTKEDLDTIGITSGKFWMYNKDGTIHITQGVPAGKQIYNTVNKMKDSNGSVMKLVQKKVGEIDDKFVNAIKK